MASLKQLLAFNIKEKRRILGISQATLAERINTSTHYIAMIELERKTPSLDMLERIAKALEIEPVELFSIQKIPFATLRKLQNAVLTDIEKAIDNVIKERLREVENSKAFQDVEIKTDK